MPLNSLDPGVTCSEPAEQTQQLGRGKGARQAGGVGLEAEAGGLAGENWPKAWLTAWAAIPRLRRVPAGAAGQCARYPHWPL